MVCVLNETSQDGLHSLRPVSAGSEDKLGNKKTLQNFTANEVEIY